MCLKDGRIIQNYRHFAHYHVLITFTKKTIHKKLVYLKELIKNIRNYAINLNSIIILSRRDFILVVISIITTICPVGTIYTFINTTPDFQKKSRYIVAGNLISNIVIRIFKNTSSFLIPEPLRYPNIHRKSCIYQ